MKKLLLMLAIVLFVTGCNTPWSPEAKLLAARESYDGIGKSLIVLCKAGAFTKAEGEQLSTVSHLCINSLDQWQAALELKQPTMGPIERFNYALREMTALRIKGERKAAKK